MRRVFNTIALGVLSVAVIFFMCVMAPVCAIHDFYNFIYRILYPETAEERADREREEWRMR